MSFETVTIGPCTLIRGDCLEVLPTLRGVDAVVTDPPWNCGYFGDGDKATWSEYRGRLSGWLAASEAVADGQAWFLSTKSVAYVSQLFADYVPFASVKNFSQMTPKRLPNCWDMAFIRHGADDYLGDGRNWFLCNTAGMLSERTEHPTPRSLDVMQYVVSMFAWNRIADPFMGSGTTGVACIKTGRQFIGIELEQKYFDIACERIRKAWKLERSKLPLEPVTRMVQRELIGASA